MQGQTAVMKSAVLYLRSPGTLGIFAKVLEQQSNRQDKVVCERVRDKDIQTERQTDKQPDRKRKTDRNR